MFNFSILSKPVIVWTVLQLAPGTVLWMSQVGAPTFVPAHIASCLSHIKAQKQIVVYLVQSPFA